MSGVSVTPGAVLIALASKEVAGQCYLDRYSTAADSVSSTVKNAIKALKCKVLRIFTTGHDQLPRLQPLSAYHTYGADYGFAVTSSRFANVNGNVNWIAGHPWDPRYNTNLADPLVGLAPISEITHIGAYGQMIREMITEGYTVTPWVFFPWQGGYSDAIINPNPGLYSGGDFGWYRPIASEAKDIADVVLDGATYAAMDALAFQKLANRRFLRNLIEVQLLDPTFIVNMGGEDWRGLPTAGPWGADAGDDQDLLYQWLADGIATHLSDLKIYAASKGWNSLRYCAGFLESNEGGAEVPIAAGTIRRDLKHCQMLIRTAGANLNYGSCSMHYRRSWEQFIHEDELTFAFFTPTGVATMREARSFFKALVAAEGYPDIELAPMANSVGDTKMTEKQIIDPYTGVYGVDPDQPQRGLMAAQFQMDLMKCGIPLAAAFNGFSKFTGSVGDAGVVGNISGVYTLQPQYYALQMINDKLDLGVSIVDVSTTEPALQTMALKWTTAGQTKLGLYFLNKQNATRSVNAALASVTNVSALSARRYSLTETTAPSVTVGDVAAVSGQTVAMTLTPFSLTYIELNITDLGSGVTLPKTPKELRKILRHDGSGFTPWSLGGALTEWLAADDLSAGAVASWAGRKGALTLAQATGSLQPVASQSSLLGFPGVTFDGVDDILDSTSFAGIQTGAVENWIWLFFNWLGTANGTLLSYGTASGTAKRQIEFASTGSQIKVTDNQTNLTDTGTPLKGRSAVVCAQFYGDHMRLRVNGRWAEPGILALTTSPLATGTARFRLGATNSNTAAAWTNAIHRHVIITTPLARDAMRLMELWGAGQVLAY
jgi:hypothetical protein